MPYGVKSSYGKNVKIRDKKKPAKIKKYSSKGKAIGKRGGHTIYAISDPNGLY